MPLVTIKTGSRIDVQNGALMKVGPSPPVASAYDTLILASSPTAYYKLDETSGLVMADSSGNVNDGAYTASVTLGSTRIVNDGGNSATFTGAAASYADILPGVTDLSSNTSPKTIECWFNTVDTVGPLVVARGPTGTPILGIYMGNDGLQVGDGKIFVLVRGNSGPLDTLASPLTYNDGSDHHVALTIGPSKEFILYIDGAAVNDESPHGLGSGITTNDPEIGRDAITTGGGPHGSFAGRIDNVAIYDSFLSAGTILAHYNAGL